MATKLEKYLKEREKKSVKCSKCGATTFGKQPTECVKCLWLAYTECVIPECNDQGEGLYDYRSHTSPEPLCEKHLSVPSQRRPPMMLRNEASEQLCKLTNQLPLSRQGDIMSFDAFRLRYDDAPNEFRDWDKTLDPNVRDQMELNLQVANAQKEQIRLAIDIQNRGGQIDMAGMMKRFARQKASLNPSQL